MSGNPDTKGQNEGFIPFNQSTPIGGWQKRRNPNQGYQNRNQNGGFRRSGGGGSGGYKNRWNNSGGNSSFEIDRSNGSHGQSFRDSINAYLHPSMLQDPWEHLRQKNQS